MTYPPENLRYPPSPLRDRRYKINTAYDHNLQIKIGDLMEILVFTFCQF